VQAAHLIGYTWFRLETIAAGHVRPDRALATIATQRDGTMVTSANIPHKVRLRHRDLRAVAIPLHYALARALVAARLELRASETHAAVKRAGMAGLLLGRPRRPSWGDVASA